MPKTPLEPYFNGDLTNPNLRYVEITYWGTANQLEIFYACLDDREEDEPNVMKTAMATVDYSVIWK